MAEKTTPCLTSSKHTGGGAPPPCSRSLQHGKRDEVGRAVKVVVTMGCGRGRPRLQ